MYMCVIWLSVLLSVHYVCLFSVETNESLCTSKYFTFLCFLFNLTVLPCEILL